MENKKVNFKYMLFCLVLLVSNLVLIGFDFKMQTAIFDIRIDNFSSNFAELFAVIIYAVLFFSLIFIKKNTFLISVTLAEIVEIIRFIFIVKNYDAASYNYSSNIMIYTLASITLLAVISYIVELKKGHYNLLRNCSMICIALYVIICALPMLTIDSYINISSLIYYFTLYSIFILSSKSKTGVM